MQPETPLVIATHNRGKLEELRQMLSPLGFQLSCAADHHVPEPEETENSFAGNAALKASHCLKHTGIASLADDSGLCVVALDGAPGVESARWGGEARDFSLAMERIRRELEARQVEPTGAAAYFICHLAVHFPDGRKLSVEGRVDGTLAFPPAGEKGFGYDPIFIPQGHDMRFAEMEPARKEAISHRAKAFAQLLAVIC